LRGQIGRADGSEITEKGYFFLVFRLKKVTLVALSKVSAIKGPIRL
jgi:hypothetical protein